MLEFCKWCQVLEAIENDLALIEKQTLYRRMELHCSEPSVGRRLSEQQQEILEADPILRDLTYSRDVLLKKKFFIQGYGELPPEVVA